MRDTLPRPEQRLSLGSELSVSPMCLGMVSRPEAVPAAFDAGINFFFITADMHWPLYTGIRRGLELLLERGGGVRDDIVVAGVSYTTQPEFCVVPFEELLEDIHGLGRLDVLIAGGAYGPELEVRLPIYASHRKRRFCGARAIGVSFHDRAAAAVQANAGTADLCMVRYNALHPGARDDLFPHVAQRRSRLYNFTNTFGYVSEQAFPQLGLPAETWCPSVTDHYRYVLGRPEIDGMLCKLDTPEHLEQLRDALDEGPLEPEEEEHLEMLARVAVGLSVLK
jgi:hypothetical protein